MKPSHLNEYQVFRSQFDSLRERVHVVLVQPQEPGNVGSACRAMGNMGIKGKLYITHSFGINLKSDAERLARHAKPQLASAVFANSLAELHQEQTSNGQKTLWIGSSARAGSANRPHPVLAETITERATAKLFTNHIDDLFLVFGREANGLTNDELDLCDVIGLIPSALEYRSLNLAQSCLLFFYEVQRCFLKYPVSTSSRKKVSRPAQKQKVIQHLMELAHVSGFILPDDPFKITPKLEGLLSKLPPHIEEARLIHGWIDQVVRSLKLGRVDYKGRYKKWMEKYDE